MNSATPPSKASRQALENANRTLSEDVARLECENKILRDELDILKRGLFGKKADRIDPAQLGLFGTEASEEAEVAAKAPASAKKVRGHGRKEFPKNLPRETIRLDVAAKDRCCGDCGAEMRFIGEDVTERGKIIPMKMVVLEYVRPKYACPQGHGVKMRDLPAGMVDKAKYDVSVYANLVVAKYGDHLPLNRLAGIYKRYGIQISKSTMWDMLVRIDEILVQALMKQMLLEVLQERILHADETPVTTRVDDQKGTKKGYIWVYCSGKKAIFNFTLSRERDGPSRVLKDWTGTLVIDGYKGYDEIVARNGITRAGCWSHARRKLKDALDTGSKDAIPVLVPVQRLFWIERAVAKRAATKPCSREEFEALRREVRKRRSSVLIEKIYERTDLLSQKRSTLPKSALGKALGYLVNQREPLQRFLEDGALDIHNNAAERALRPIALGRNNWLVFGSQKGGEVAARLYSLTFTCKALGIDPEAYLADALERVAANPTTDIASLTPWAWAENRAAAAAPQA